MGLYKYRDHLWDVIEKLTNQAMVSYLADRIFRPLGMIHTDFDPTSAIIPKMAEGYTYEQGKLTKSEIVLIGRSRLALAEYIRRLAIFFFGITP